MTRFRTVFPDLQVSIDRIFASENRVITQVTYRGTHSGAPFLGQEPLDRRIEVPGLDVFVMRDGKCVEHLHVADHLDLVLQMGLTLQPTAATADTASSASELK